MRLVQRAHVVVLPRVRSKGPQALVPICPSQTIPRKGGSKGVPQTHQCLGFHAQNPTYHPHGKQRAGAKRARGAGDARGPPPAADEDEEEDILDA